MAVAIDVIVGLASVGVAIAAGIWTYVWFSQYHAATVAPHVREGTALMTFGAFMSVGMLVPQIIKNAQLGSAIHDSQSPFLPAILPVVVLSKFAAERNTLVALHNSGCRYSMVVRIVMQFFILIIAEVWIFQFAAAASDVVLEVVLYTAGGVYALIILSTLSWVFRVVTHGGDVADRGSGNVHTFDNTTYDPVPDDDPAAPVQDCM